MSDYVTISGTLQDPINVADTQFPSTTIEISSSQFSFYNPLPITRKINLTKSGEYNFNLLKGSNYTIKISTKPQAGSTGTRNEVSFSLEVPDIVDENVEYDLFSFNVTNFTPLLEQNDVTFARFLEDNNPYLLRIENGNLVVRDLTYTRQKTINQMFNQNGILNNNSFEYDLLAEDYTFNPIEVISPASVTTSYNGDIPSISSSSDYNIYEDSRSLQLVINNSGVNSEDILLKQKLLPNILIPNQRYRLRGYFKLVSGTPLTDITILIENTNGTLITFDNVTLVEDSNGWNYYDSIVYCTDELDLIDSSQETYFKVQFGAIGNITIRLDRLKLEEYYNI